MIDKHSDAWREVAAWAVDELSKAIEQNETPGLPVVETEGLRGRIACLRELLGLVDEPEQRAEVVTEDYGFQEPGPI